MNEDQTESLNIVIPNKVFFIQITKYLCKVKKIESTIEENKVNNSFKKIRRTPSFGDILPVIGKV